MWINRSADMTKLMVAFHDFKKIPKMYLNIKKTSLTLQSNN
jgi:hypothetical protein